MAGKHDTVTAQTPNYSLKEKLGEDVNIKDALTDDAIAGAENIIKQTQNDFFKDAKSDLDTMEELYANAVKNPEADAKPVKKIEQRAFSLKGQAETLGFDLLSHACKSLYDFCSKHFKNGDEEQLIVIRKHLDTLKVIIKEEMRGDGGKTGSALIESLGLLTKKYST